MSQVDRQWTRLSSFSLFAHFDVNGLDQVLVLDHAGLGQYYGTFEILGPPFPPFISDILQPLDACGLDHVLVLDHARLGQD